MDENLKLCTICEQEKPLEEFRWKLNSKGIRYRTSPCIPCARRIAQKRYDSSGRETAIKRYRENRMTLYKLRKTVLEAYGNKCACCGEAEDAALCIDHADLSGKQHRALKKNWGIINDIIREGFPDKYRLLCWTCNAMTRFGKPCFHEKFDTASVIQGLAC
jgi:predicted restriction endonuclease